MNELNEKLEILRNHKEFLQKEYHVSRIGIFGSMTHGLQKPRSDIDVLVEFEKPIGLFTFIELEKYLNSLTKKKVDLVSSRALKPSIRQSILNSVVYA